MWLRRSLIPAFAGVALSHCSSPGSGGSTCYPDNDGVNDVPSPIELVVDDTGFYAGSADAGALTDAGMKTVITTQNASTITLSVTNLGTMPHGFEVDCTSALAAYPDLPVGCSPMVCFPGSSTIPPLAPGASMTATFVTPVPDNLLFPFKSSAPGDADNPALNGSNGSAWSLM
jgi:hypothetical protein